MTLPIYCGKINFVYIMKGNDRLKPEKAVIQNTVYIAIWQVILTGLMHAVFLIIGRWGVNVLIGSLIGAFAAVANFFAMAMTVQKAVTLEPKDAAAKMKLSQTLRFLALVVAAVIGCLVADPFATVIPLVFPRFAIMLFPLFDKKKGESQQ